MNSRFVDFTPIRIRLFMGGNFDLGRPKTVGELREALKEIDAELASWGDIVAISEVALVKDKIQVTLQDGVADL